MTKTDIDLGQPWELAPREGKHYGTKILDRDGNVTMTIWTSGQELGCEVGEAPSLREQARYTNYTPEWWARYSYDTHYECQRDFERAVALIQIVNDAAPIKDQR